MKHKDMTVFDNQPSTKIRNNEKKTFDPYIHRLEQKKVHRVCVSFHSIFFVEISFKADSSANPVVPDNA
jgi:hypothetical protein